MGRKNSKSRAEKASRALLGNGISALGIGLAFLLMPLFLSGSAALRPVSQGLRMPALFAIAIGVVLIALHVLLRPKQPKEPAPRREPSWSPPVPPPRPEWSTQSVQATQRSSPIAAAQSTLLSSRRTPAGEWSPKVFEAIEWRRFEAVCEQLFAQGGFETRTQSHGADGGVDIWLHSRHAEGPAAIVQCKHWQGKQVGVKELREFYGVMSSHKLKRGTYATSSTFTADATTFAKENGISSLDGNGLLALIAKRTPEQQQALLNKAYEGEYWRPTCARCGTKMVERAKKNGGASFWGCTGFPSCKSTLPMRTLA